MLSANPFSSRFMTAAFLVATIATFGLHLRAQDKSGPQATPYSDDWTHHRLVFSDPGTREDAARRGSLDKWFATTNSPRFKMQQLKRGRGTLPVTSDPSFDKERGRGGDFREVRRRPHEPNPVVNTILKDWSLPLGGTAGSGTSITVSLAAPGSGNISGSSTLTIGPVTFDASPPVAEKGTITFGPTAPKPNGGGSWVTLGSATYVYNFVASGSATVPASGCNVVSANAAGGGATLLYNAIFNIGTPSTTTHNCAAGFTLNPNFNSVSSTVSAGTITLYAATAGSTGFATFTSGGTPNFASGPSTTAGNNGTTDGTVTPPTFAYWNNTTYSNASTVASNIATAAGQNATATAAFSVTANGSAGAGTVVFAPRVGGSFTAGSGSFSAVTLNPSSGNFGGADFATVQPNASPAKYGASLTTADCTNDFVVYPTGQVGGASAATIIAYNNLYSACGAPTVYWSYNTGSAAVTTSPIFSYLGKMVAFVQSDGTTASLVVLKPVAGSGGSITSPTTLVASTDITTCTAPCMTVTPLGADDTYSSPYYTYNGDNASVGGDTIFVGTDNAKILKISPVFAGAAPTGTLPSVTLSGAAAPASPVFDADSGCIFVGDITGYLYSIDAGFSTTGTTCKSGVFQNFGHSADLALASGSYGIYDAPLVDSTAGRVYVFVTQAPGGAAYCTINQNCVYQFTTASSGTGSIPFASSTATAAGHANLGVGGTNGSAVYQLYDGMFDNIYFSSGTPTSPSGDIYVVGGTGSTTAGVIYRVPIASNTLGAPVNALGATGNNTVTSGNEYPWPSPATEFLNGSTDYLFFSVNRGATTKGCTGTAGAGCILSFNITTTTVSQSGTGGNYGTPPTNGCWATGGIVIDNSDASGSDLYFISLNGVTAGGANGTSPVSSGCTTGSMATINAIQGLQNNP